MQVGHPHLENGIFAEKEIQDKKAPDSDGGRIIARASCDPEFQDKYARIEPYQRQNCGKRHGPCRDTRLFIHPCHINRNVADDAERISEHKYPDKQYDGIKQIRRGSQKPRNRPCKNKDHNRNGNNGNEAEPQPLPVDLSCPLLIAVSQLHGRQCGNTDREETSQRQHKIFQRHDQPYAGKPCLTQTSSYNNAFQNDHNRLCQHSDQCKEAVLHKQPRYRFRTQFPGFGTLFLSHFFTHFVVLLPLSPLDFCLPFGTPLLYGCII